MGHMPTDSVCSRLSFVARRFEVAAFEAIAPSWKTGC
jgi:hypothetical protein